MSANLLFSLRKLLHWLFAFLMALLPQHLISQLSDTEFLPLAAYTLPDRTPRVLPVAAVVASPTQDSKPVASGNASSADTQARLAR